MRAFKFRPATQIEFAFDIILKRRLYCAPWSQLNDPMEGIFAYTRSASDETDEVEAFIEKLVEHKKPLRVCSLSRTFDCHLLWSHYASGFSGVAIEVDLPNRPDLVRNVEYGGVFGVVNFASGLNPSITAREVLSRKYREWEYEQEVRVLQSEEWFRIRGPVRRVIAGQRMNPSLFEAMRIVCRAKSIPFCRTGIGDEGIDADHVD